MAGVVSLLAPWWGSLLPDYYTTLTSRKILIAAVVANFMVVCTLAHSLFCGKESKTCVNALWQLRGMSYFPVPEV